MGSAHVAGDDVEGHFDTPIQSRPYQPACSTRLQITRPTATLPRRGSLRASPQIVAATARLAVAALSISPEMVHFGGGSYTCDRFRIIDGSRRFRGNGKGNRRWRRFSSAARSAAICFASSSAFGSIFHFCGAFSMIRPPNQNAAISPQSMSVD